jgi:hypothetical protein
MSLHEVLLATRDLILESPNLPTTVAERLLFIRNHFPKLSPAERADFAQIEPARWQIYTKSIFIGERELLKKRFPLTFALLSRHYEAVLGKPFRPYDFVFELSHKRPWRTNKNLEFFSNFRDHITYDFPEFTTQLPYLSEVVQLELDRYQLLRHISETFHVRENLSIDQIRELTVDELLGLKVIINPAQVVRKFHFDIPRYFAQFRDAQDTLPAMSPHERSLEETTYAVGCRNGELRVRWCWVSEGTQKFFEKCTAENKSSAPIAELTESFLAHTSFPSDEARAFEAFMAELMRLKQAEILALIP